MPGFVMHKGAVVICAHGGKAEPAVINPRIKLSGMEAVFAVSPYMVSGCAFPPPPAGNGPCVSGMFVKPATRVKSMGQPLLLNDAKGVETPTGVPQNIVMAQMRVKGQ